MDNHSVPKKPDFFLYCNHWIICDKIMQDAIIFRDLTF